jgi:glutathione synthase/RimK-type ligase-like ATP-grasp enzyme
MTMAVRLAIHHREGSFSQRWMGYCEEHHIPYRRVCCYDSDIVRQLTEVDALLWHWVHYVAQDVVMARELTRVCELMGLKVFPDHATAWHYDDKIAQKYLLESVSAPCVPTYVFYDRDTAMQWIERASYPLVFKLRRGSGSQNVHKVDSLAEARRLARRAFGKGFVPVKDVGDFVRQMGPLAKRAWRMGNLGAAARKLPTVLSDILVRQRVVGRESGYLYLQDFLPNNLYDTRITVIGNRAFGFTRGVRDSDFRASGSGRICHDVGKIDLRCVSSAFEVARKLKAKSIAFDFVMDREKQPRILEISYCYQAKAVYDCAGQWDEGLNWREGHMWPQDAILMDVLADLERR